MIFLQISQSDGMDLSQCLETNIFSGSFQLMNFVMYGAFVPHKKHTFPGIFGRVLFFLHDMSPENTLNCVNYFDLLIINMSTIME